MLNNIQSALEQLGLSAQKRAIHIQFSNATLNSQVFLQRIDGQHSLNKGLRIELICLSTDATISLKKFIGCQASIDQVTDKGLLFRTTGIITEASQGQSDGSLTLYKFILEDPTSLWHKRRNSRVFMNKSVVEIIQTLFSEWQERSSILAASLSLDLAGLQNNYDVRPFVMQMNETDFDFLTRLMRSEGINWLIDEAALFVQNVTAEIQPQKLRLIDNNNQFQALTRRNIRYHRSSATEKQDSITSFIGKRSLQSTAVHVQRWQADALVQEEGSGTIHSKHKHSENYDNVSLGLEQAWNVTPAWIQDLKGEDGVTASNNKQIEKLNKNWKSYFDTQAKKFVAKSTVRDIQVGYWFEFKDHPEIDQHSGSDKEFLVISKSFYNQNNLPKDLTDQVNQLLSQSQWQAKTVDQDERQANQLSLQRRNNSIVPEFNPLKHRPVAYPQRARVVGPSSESIYVDEWGRIKVRFLFTRHDDHLHDGGAGSNENDTDSAWVDVLTPWAGDGYGARFLPRIDEIVVLDFFDGDIDRPFVVGRLHEAHRSPTKFDAKGQLPDTKKISGIRSKEVGGGGFNQLRFDDTTGQISAQLQSSHGATQLNLGNLSHPKESAESKRRGQGFELRTDQWGVLRAGQGLLLSTYMQNLAKEDHLDAIDSKKQLQSSHLNLKGLSDIAKNQKVDEAESIEKLKAYAELIEQDVAQFKKAILLITSPESIAISTPEDIYLSTDGHINQIASDSIQLSTQKNLIGQALDKISLFAAQSGASLVTGKGKLELQAQDDALDVLAKKGITISSTSDKIEISSPKEIIITAGGSQLKIDGSGIYPTTGGKFEVKASQHVFQPGQSVNKSAKLPSSKPLKGAMELLRSYGQQDFFKNNAYKVIDVLGKEVKGKLDGNGFAMVTGIAPGPAQVIFEKEERSAWDPASHFTDRKYQWSNGFVSSAKSGSFLDTISSLGQGLMDSVGQNMMSQLKDNLFSLNADNLKNMGQNILKDLGDQTLGQLKDQVMNGALGAITSNLNINLTSEQLMNIGEIAMNPGQSLQDIKDQGIDFFKDQASAMLSQMSNVNLSSTPGIVAQGFNAVGGSSEAPVSVTDDFLKQDEYFSQFLTYTQTTREIDASSASTSSSQKQDTAQTASTIPTAPKNPSSSNGKNNDDSKKGSSSSNSSPTASEQPILVEDNFLRQDIYESRNLTITQTVREVNANDAEAMNARNKPN